MPGQRLGYRRVSRYDQQPDRQLAGVPVDRLFTDQASGRDTKRPALAALLEYARAGDTILVHSLDRLGRNLLDLQRLVQDLTDRGIEIRFLQENLTFTSEDTPLARLLLAVIGSIAEFERARLRERQREGIAIARQKGPTRAVGWVEARQ